MHDWPDPRQIDELWGSLYADLRRRGADAEQAKDISQEAWLYALRGGPGDQGRLLAWLRVVSKRLLHRSRVQEAARVHRERLAWNARGERDPRPRGGRDH